MYDFARFRVKIKIRGGLAYTSGRLAGKGMKDDLQTVRVERGRPSRAFLLLAFSLALLGTTAEPMLAESTTAAADPQSLLKPDVPKFDLSTPSGTSRTLKGGVQHEVTELSVGEKNLKDKKLSSGVFDIFKKKKSVKLSSQTARNGNGAPLKAGANNNSLQANAATNVPNGIGIIGVKFLLSFGRMPIINRVFPGTPAWTMGLKAADVIVAVDGVPTLGLSKEDVYGMIVGKPDTEVTISIRRNGDFIAKTMKRMDFNDIPDPAVRQDYLMSI
jgi:hypothetical protein